MAISYIPTSESTNQALSVLDRSSQSLLDFAIAQSQAKLKAKLDEEDRKRQEKRDRLLNRETAIRIKAQQQSMELEMQKFGADQAEAMQKRQEEFLKMAAEEVKRMKAEQTQTGEIYEKLYQSKVTATKPGQAFDEQTLTAGILATKNLLAAQGRSIDEINDAIKLLPVAKPEEELSTAGMLDAATKLMGTSPEIASSLLEQVGIKATPEQLTKAKETPVEVRSALSHIGQLQADDRISPEQARDMVKRTLAGDLEAAYTADLKSKPLGPLAGTELAARLFIAKGDKEAEAEVVAELKNRQPETRRADLEYQPVYNRKGLNAWEVREYNEAKLLYDKGYISKDDMMRYNKFRQEMIGVRPSTPTLPEPQKSSGYTSESGWSPGR